MLNLLFSPAYADTAAAGSSGGSSMLEAAVQFGPILLIFVIFYFLLIRPQQTRQKKLREQLANLRRGDQVITAGGIIGEVQATRPEASEIDVLIAPNVKVRVARQTIASVISKTKPANEA
ncbi:preprotein translocase subunit YajC [Acetobacteraceae bacterium]|nr:preprotein translocase subunit YajC [Acetobacteraceae bacterium]